jgi:hypothetical protein
VGAIDYRWSGISAEFVVVACGRASLIKSPCVSAPEGFDVTPLVSQGGTAADGPLRRGQQASLGLATQRSAMLDEPI